MINKLGDGKIGGLPETEDTNILYKKLRKSFASIKRR